MKEGDRLYTKEPDGSVQRWYVWALFGPCFSVSVEQNANRSAYKRYYHMDDLGKIIFISRKEANHAPSKLLK